MTLEISRNADTNEWTWQIGDETGHVRGVLESQPFDNMRDCVSDLYEYLDGYEDSIHREIERLAPN